MEANKEVFGMLDLMTRPGFCVEKDRICYVNAPAQALLLCPGTDVRELLLTGQEEYAALEDGCLYLQLNLVPQGCGATVMIVSGLKVFLLDQESDDDALRALALAARTLREPLSAIQLSLDRLDTARKEPMEYAHMNRAIHQMLRILGNMSDAGRSPSAGAMELRDIPRLIQEILEQTRTLAEKAGVQLSFRSSAEGVLGLVDIQLLERAILNMLANAIKFSPAGNALEVQLSRRGRILVLSLTDRGSGIGERIRQNIFRQYLRQPGIEEGRQGLGLGMVLIRNAAARHGGTVLIDQPNGTGTRISMTLAIRQDTCSLHSPVLRVDYTGEQDHTLVELADFLPLDVYQK